MRVVELGKYYPPDRGGIENNLRLCCLELARVHEVHALVFNRTWRTVEEEREGIHVIRAGSLGRVASQELAPTLARHLRRLRPEVVHLHAPNPLATLACLLAAPDVPLVVTHHADVVGKGMLGALVQPLYRRVLHRAARVVLYTRQYAETSPEVRPVLHKVTIIPHGIDATLFADAARIAPRARQLRADLGGTVPLVAFMGRHVHYKGIDVLLQALARLDGVHAVIGGAGPLLETHRALARTLGLARRVHFPGEVDELAKLALYTAADVVVLPSRSRAEAFGQVQVEAQLCRRPVVASAVPGMAEVTVDGETGLLVPPEAPAPLAEAIRRLLDDAPLRRQMGAAGHQRAHARYTQSVVGGQLRRLVDEVAAGAG